MTAGKELADRVAQAGGDVLNGAEKVAAGTALREGEVWADRSCWLIVQEPCRGAMEDEG